VGSLVFSKTSMMKRSTQVAAPLLASAAMAMLSGCHPQDMQRCVDENNKVVDQSFCQQTGQQHMQQRPDGHGGFIFVPLLYHYYYGGYGGFTPGSVVGGGAFTPTPGRSYSTTSRGGFGSSFSHSSGGEGGHGGGAGE
jgi:hypothetical protein